jgi:glycosyltransferase involved in cell wall biosynthesis
LVFNQEHRDYFSKTFFLPKSKFQILPINILNPSINQKHISFYKHRYGIKPKDFIVLFVGNFLIPQNLIPLKQLISQSLQSLSNIKYLIVGSTPPDLQFPPNFILAGFIKDLENIYPLSNVSLAPTSQGSGIKTKILLSLLAKIPVITTPQGANFLPSNINVTITDPSNIVQTINQLSTRNLLAPMGYKYVSENFTTKPFSKLLDHLFQTSISKLSNF